MFCILNQIVQRSVVITYKEQIGESELVLFTVNIYRINFTTIPFSHYYLFWKSKLFLKNSYIYKTISDKPCIFYNVLKLEIMVVNEMQEPCSVNRGAGFHNPNWKLIVPMQPIRSLGCIYFVLEFFIIAICIKP